MSYVMNPRSKTVHIVGPDDFTWCRMSTELWPRADLALAKVCKVCVARLAEAEALAARPVDHEREALRAARRAEHRAIIEPWLLADPVYVAACSDNGWGTDVFHAIDIGDEPLNFGDLVDDDAELDDEAWKAHRPGRLAWAPMCGRARVWLLEPPEDWDQDAPIVDRWRHLRHCTRCGEAVHGRALERAELLGGS